MTLEEATVAMQHGLTVELIPNVVEGVAGQDFTITSLTKYLPKYEKYFAYRACVSKNGKAYYEVDIRDLKAKQNESAAYEVFLSKLCEKNLHQIIKQIILKGNNKTQTVKLVKAAYDTVKKSIKA